MLVCPFPPRDDHTIYMAAIGYKILKSYLHTMFISFKTTCHNESATGEEGPKIFAIHLVQRVGTLGVQETNVYIGTSKSNRLSVLSKQKSYCVRVFTSYCIMYKLLYFVTVLRVQLKTETMFRGRNFEPAGVYSSINR